MGAAFILGFWVVSLLLRMTSRNAPEPAAEAPGDPAPQRWFEVLEVDEHASGAEITAAYKRRISQYHPDRVQQMGPELIVLAEARSREINAAYATALKRSGRP